MPHLDYIAIKDYAYNTTPNEPILAGDTGGEVCSPPAETNLAYVTSNRVKFNWLPIDDATEYQVEFVWRERLNGVIIPLH